MLISSRKNDMVRCCRELMREKKSRDERGELMAEGDHLCGELARLDYEIPLALYTERAAEKYPETIATLRQRAAGTAVITEEVAEYISDTKSPQGVFAVGKKPVRELSALFGARRLVILDGVQDPGNVGTVIRTAEALGIDGAILVGGCADIWSPKTIRASMGSVFRLACISGSAGDILSRAELDGFCIYGAMLDKNALRLGEMRFAEKSAVVIGSEGGGISDEVKRLCAGTLYIPISGAESLNAAAAAAIILWELSRGV